MMSLRVSFDAIERFVLRGLDEPLNVCLRDGNVFAKTGDLQLDDGDFFVRVVPCDDDFIVVREFYFGKEDSYDKPIPLKRYETRSKKDCVDYIRRVFEDFEE